MGTLTATGYDRSTYEEWKSAIEADWLSEFGAGTDVSDESPDGRIIRILAYHLAQLDSAVEAVYQAIDPESAAGIALDNLISLLGLSRLPASYSQIPDPGVTLTGTPATVVPAGTQFSVSATGEVFSLDADVTIGAGGTGTGGVTATNTGPVAAAVGALDTIVTPVVGLSSVTNTVAATLGTDEETDAELRARREASLSATGAGTVDAMYAHVAAVTGVQSVSVVEDTSAHTVSVYVLGGTDADIAEAVWESKPAGIETLGTTSVTVTDAAGGSQTVKFTRAAEVSVYVSAQLTVDSDYPADGDDQVAAQILAALASGVEYDDAYSGTVTSGYAEEIGDDVIEGLVVRAIYQVPGVVSHSIQVDTVSPPVATGNLTIPATSVAAYDISRIVVTH